MSVNIDETVLRLEKILNQNETTKKDFGVGWRLTDTETDDIRNLILYIKQQDNVNGALVRALLFAMSAAGLVEHRDGEGWVVTRSDDGGLSVGKVV